jgi:hypothetical protein
MIVRSKDESQNKGTSSKHASFTFRRIQSRELYQPSQESDGRLRFRIRVQLIGRTH